MASASSALAEWHRVRREHPLYGVTLPMPADLKDVDVDAVVEQLRILYTTVLRHRVWTSIVNATVDKPVSHHYDESVPRSMRTLDEHVKKEFSSAFEELDARGLLDQSCMCSTQPAGEILNRPTIDFSHLRFS
jgi:hypothetical protein